MKMNFKVGELKLRIDEEEINLKDLECNTEMTPQEAKEYIAYCLEIFKDFAYDQSGIYRQYGKSVKAPTTTNVDEDLCAF